MSEFDLCGAIFEAFLLAVQLLANGNVAKGQRATSLVG